MKVYALNLFDMLIWATLCLDADAFENRLGSRQMVEEDEESYSDLVHRWRHNERARNKNADDNATTCADVAIISTDKLIYYEGEEVRRSCKCDV